jgi:hypothetical protein
VLEEERRTAAPQPETSRSGIPASNDTDGQEPSTDELIRIIQERAKR